ncbi:MAG: T9SS type A sorting domain-containing protein [Calditrichaeota bacterium]|jgi:hypothetical protein|nr:T9SS type A sorting domain-containing protein [Calditrichota bacterium]
MYRNFILSATLILICISVLHAQDSTFTFEETYRHQPDRDHVFDNLLTVDLNGNGMREIITTQLNLHTNDHKLTRLENRDTLSVGPYENAFAIGTDIHLLDFNQDGLNDIIYTANINEMMIYYGPEYELGYSEHDYFGQNKITDCGNRKYSDGTINPIFIVGLRGGPLSANRIIEGTWEDGGHPRYLNTVCKGDFTTRIIDGETVYFAMGGIERFDTIFYMLYTSFNCDFEIPDSLNFYNPGDVFDSGICQRPIVEDLNGNGRLEWVVPFWEEVRDSIFNISLFIYEPDSLTRIGEQQYEGTENHYSISPYPIRGVAAVDVNDNGEYEILLVVQNEPIRIIDVESLEVIMISEFVVPDDPNYYFACGYFDDTRRLQVLLQDDQTTDFIIYNLPEGWTKPPDEYPHPVSVNDTRIVLLPDRMSFLPPYPNPFNSTTTITYTLPKSGEVILSIHDLQGREITVLQNTMQTAGLKKATWNAGDQPSGLYFCRLESVGKVATTKLMLVK